MTDHLEASKLQGNLQDGLFIVTSTEKPLKKNSGIRDSTKGLKQVGDIQCSGHLHPQFTLICN